MNLNGIDATRWPHWRSDDGNVLLINADCLEVLPTMPIESTHLVITDPPYGHNNNNGDLIHRREVALGKSKVVQEDRKIANDGAEANDIIRQVLPYLNRLLHPGSCCCCCCGGGGGPDPQFAHWSLWIDDAIGFKQMVVWDKGPMGMGWHYRRSYETVLVAEKPGAACRWRDKSNAIENIIRPGQYGIRKIIPSKDDHPTPKPVELASHFIGLHSDPGDLVFDPFMGRAWVGVAAIRMDRKFIGIEIDQEHYDFSVEKCKAEQDRFPLFENKKPATADQMLF